MPCQHHTWLFSPCVLGRQQQLCAKRILGCAPDKPQHTLPAAEHSPQWHLVMASYLTPLRPRATWQTLRPACIFSIAVPAFTTQAQPDMVFTPVKQDTATDVGLCLDGVTQATTSETCDLQDFGQRMSDIVGLRGHRCI